MVSHAHRYFRETTRILANDINPALSIFQTKWRVATSRLLPASYMHASSQNHIRNAHTALTTFLQPLVESNRAQQCFDNLHSILTSAAQFGWVLFSQPARHEFVWKKDGTDIVVFPGLVQVTNEEGELLTQGNVLMKPLGG
jgi:hypothetical protein